VSTTELSRLAAGAPWLADARRRVADALAAGRLPHALLVQGPPGLGKAALADWIARLALCERPGADACGECASCQLHAVGNHPDLRRLGIPEDKTQIPVEDVRELIEALGLKSFRGGRKVAIVDPADGLNRNGANALLKTIEEPGAEALVVLSVARPERLPATIASRCQRLAIRVPAAPVALAWLAAREARGDWPALLALVAGAPVGALALAARGAGEVPEQMAEFPTRVARPGADLVAEAERCKDAHPFERLRWIENWVTERIRRGLTAADPGHSVGSPGLPSVARTRHIQSLYEILDEVRSAQAALRGTANPAMVWERVIGLVARELHAVRGAAGRR
jgi:DNA polymerase-3 subunit delta'